MCAEINRDFNNRIIYKDYIGGRDVNREPNPALKSPQSQVPTPQESNEPALKSTPVTIPPWAEWWGDTIQLPACQPGKVHIAGAVSLGPDGTYLPVIQSLNALRFRIF